MKTLPVVALALTGCMSELDDVPATPHVTFYAGRLARGESRSMQSGERLMADAEIGVYTSWYGICYERDPVSDKDIGTPCDLQPYELTASCTGAGCPEPAKVNSDDSEARLTLRGTGTGAVSLLISMRNLRTQETPTALRELELVPPDAVALRDAAAPLAPPPAFPSARSASPILRIDGQLEIGGEAVFFPSPAFTVNGQAVTADDGRYLIDLRALFPAAVQPDGSLAIGNYELQIAYPGKTWTSSVRVQL